MKTQIRNIGGELFVVDRTGLEPVAPRVLGQTDNLANRVLIPTELPAQI